MSLLFDTSWLSVDWWMVLLMPVLAAGVGGVGSWISLRLLFGPLHLSGSGGGLLDQRVECVADRLAAILGTQIRLADLFRLMEPEKLAAHVSDSVMGRLEEYVDGIMAERYSVLWANLPQVIRQRVYDRIGRQLPAILDNLVEDMAENVDELVDIRQLINCLILEKRQSLACLLSQVLDEERRFLLRAGIWTGLVLGVLQLLVCVYFPAPWVMVLTTVGVAVAALLFPRSLMFPADPASVTLSKVLLSDQPRLERALAHRFAEDIFSLRRLMQMMLTGPREARARSMMRRHMRPLLEAGLVRTTVQMMLGAEGYAYIKQMVVERVSELTLEALADGMVYQRGNDKVEDACMIRIGRLRPVELREMVQSVLDEGLWIRLAAVASAGLVLGAMEFWLLSAISG
jgi:hypothetical protein